MSWYRAIMNCKCGQPHWLTGALRIPCGPAEAGTVAELYPDGELPPVVAELLHDLVWCDDAQEYVEIADPGRVVLTPTERW